MKTTKRMAGLLLMAFFLALTTSCAVEEDNGLFLIGVSDCLTDYPEDGGTYQGHGRLDTYVKTMQRASSGYTKQLVYMLDEESSRNSNYLQGEGNRVYLRGIEIKFDVPEGFPKIPKRFEPTNKKLEPGSRWLWGFTMLDNATIELIDQALRDMAYGSRRGVYLARPPASEEGGGDCTPLTAGEDCFGYACVDKATGTILTDPNAQGICATTCTAQLGCSQVCAPRRSNAAETACTNSSMFYFVSPGKTPAYYCDESADTVGVCRPTCSSNADCAGLVDGYELGCMDNVCRPVINAGEVDPHGDNYINVKIRLKAERTNGDIIWSNSVNFELNVCRECLIDYNVWQCVGSPMGTDEDFDAWTDTQESLGNTCLYRYEEVSTTCADLYECYGWMCLSGEAEVAYDLDVIGTIPNASK